MTIPRNFASLAANTNTSGQITSSGLAATAVTAGTYGGNQLKYVTVDAQGRITGAANVSSSTFFTDGTNVGVGTASPSTYGKFAVIGKSYSSTGYALTSDSSNYTPSGVTNSIPNYGLGAPETSVVSVSGFESLRFYTNQVERMRLDSAGNLLLGTTSSATPSTGYASVANTFGFKNRIINGAMVIDQRYAGAATPNTISAYTLDRFVVAQTTTGKLIVQQNAGAVTAPTGFSKYLGITSQSAYSVLTGDTFYTAQVIEGFNTYDLNWGTANAATVTLSFWVRSSLTGTFGGALANYLSGTTNRSYPFSYTISAANTWEQKTITIAGDTSGTWTGATSDGGIVVRFGVGSGSTYSGTAGAWATGNLVQPTSTVSVVGTNAATFYITGVQLEKGSVATSFDYRPYGTELKLCQRYFQFAGFGLTGSGATTSIIEGLQAYYTPMRAAPTASITSGVTAYIRMGNSNISSASPVLSNTSITAYAIWTQLTGFTGVTAGAVMTANGNGPNNFISLQSEL